ncbi:MAG: hypothetical protein ACKVQA_26095, partial [Burkholderiales bacterium]
NDLSSLLQNVEGEKEQARLFEIGHQGPVELSATQAADGLHPVRPGARELKGVYWIVALMACAFVLWWRCSNHWKPLAHGGQPVPKAYCQLLMNPAISFVLVPLGLYVAYRIWKSQALDGEPLTLTDGISSYFFFSMSAVAILISFYLALKTLAILFKGEAFLEAEYFPSDLPEQKPIGNRFWSALLLMWKHERLVQKRVVYLDPHEFLMPRLLWDEFQLSGKWRFRLIRAASISLIVLTGMYFASDLAHEPASPVRGGDARFYCEVALWCSIVTFIFLGALIFDSLWLNRIFIDWFGKGESEWSVQQVRLEYIQDLSWSDRCDYTDLRLVADWTKDIGRLTALPFYSLAIMLLARLNYFDIWRWPLPVVGGLVLIIAMVMLGSYRIHSAAERLRNSTIQRLLKSKSALDKNSAANRLIDEIRHLSHGAFKPFLKQPVMEAFYWLISALSMSGLAQALAQMIG